MASFPSLIRPVKEAILKKTWEEESLLRNIHEPFPVRREMWTAGRETGAGTP
jgi:hypothetical protein